MTTPSFEEDRADPVQVMRSICRDRHRAWSLLTELTRPDPEAWTAGLADRLVQLGSATSWLTEQWRPDGILLLEGLTRRAARRGQEDVVGLVRDATIAAQPGPGRLHRAVAAVHELCAQELAAWERADAAAAKQLRVEQMTLLVPDSTLRTEARVLGSARLPVWSPVADVVTAYLLLETGR